VRKAQSGDDSKLTTHPSLSYGSADWIYHYIVQCSRYDRQFSGCQAPIWL